MHAVPQSGASGITVIFETVHGSRAYGLATETSDTDRRGVFVPSPADMHGFLDRPDQVEPEPERVLYEVRKLFRLAAASNPTVIEILFTEPSDHITVTPEGRWLLDRRQEFLSRMAGDSFGKYGLAQLHRIRTHRRWLLSPPRAKPERPDFGLPERLTIPKDQQGALEAMAQDGRIVEQDLPAGFLDLLERERRYRGALREWQQYQDWTQNRNPARAELEIDYTSHELGFALRLLLRGNGNMLERILSPYQLLDSPDAQELRRLAREAACKRFFHHYRGFFGRMCQDWRKAEPRTVKGLLYAYRSALTGVHLLRTGECVGDVTRLAPLYGFERVAELVARKGSGTEHGPMGASDTFDDDLDRLESLLSSAHSESALPEASANVAEIDRFLVDVRRRYFA